MLSAAPDVEGLYVITLSNKETAIPTGSEITLSETGDFSDDRKEDITHLIDFEVADEMVMTITADKKSKE
ncbi:hypothetical protein [Vibrio barjaei]|uniref:Uncharacterized protein n=1 Tax=Vibrio barjaei TaxID=1676683 RepID=A0ABW7INW7_9VIBR|nr:hypothetical protein [Vibrio barjaei]MCY9870064.1 hypothetical protein [Vibrio barjaei]